VHAIGGLAVDGDGYRVTIAFKDARDKPHRLHTRAKTRTAFRPGQEVDVMYDPADPAGSARVDRAFRAWLWPLLAVIAGLLMLVFRRATGAGPGARSSRYRW